MPSEPDELTLDKLRATLRSLGPAPQMPRWKDLTWAQRNMIEREIDATENQLVRNAMREAYYCDDDKCPWHRAVVAGQGAERGEGED